MPPGFSFPCPCYPGPAPVPPGFQDCTAQQIASLPHLIGVFHLPPGVGNSLLVKAQAVQSSFGSGNKTAACNQLNALINEAQAQTGKQLTAQQSKQLIAAAQLARKMLGCK